LNNPRLVSCYLIMKKSVRLSKDGLRIDLNITKNIWKPQSKHLL
jgi:hypothetical protein